MLNNPISLVRELKGAPLSCLFACLIAHQAVGAEWVARVTGYTDKPVKQALLLLEELGFLVRINRCHWGLSAGAAQLPLMAELSIGTRNYSDSGPTTTTTTIEGTGDHKEEVVVEGKSSRNNSDSIEEIVTILHEGGVGEPTASRLAGLGWVTPDYIRAHLEKGRENQDDLALVIHRMKSHDPAPEGYEDRDMDERRRYISGRYAEFIQH
jgi:hypothetical protein